jgi:hypothetical protein
MNAGTTKVAVQTQGRRVRICAPVVVERFVAYLRRWAGRSPLSLHIDHDHV